MLNKQRINERLPEHTTVLQNGKQRGRQKAQQRVLAISSCCSLLTVTANTLNKGSVYREQEHARSDTPKAQYLSLYKLLRKNQFASILFLFAFWNVRKMVGHLFFPRCYCNSVSTLINIFVLQLVMLTVNNEEINTTQPFFIKVMSFFVCHFKMVESPQIAHIFNLWVFIGVSHFILQWSISWYNCIMQNAQSSGLTPAISLYSSGFPLKGSVMQEDEAGAACFLICWKCHKVCGDLLSTVSKSYACGPSVEEHLSSILTCLTLVAGTSSAEAQCSHVGHSRPPMARLQSPWEHLQRRLWRQNQSRNIMSLSTDKILLSEESFYWTVLPSM